MATYNYLENILSDIRDYLKNDYDGNAAADLMEDRDALEEKLHDDLWICDSITGNASGSYTFNAWQAEENLCHNMDLLREACEEFGQDMGDAVNHGAEYCDVTIRCYLLGSAISQVLDEIEETVLTDERPC